MTVNIALFGGTFDPIHSGHLKVAGAAARKFNLDSILFVPSGTPPHKLQNQLTNFNHRFAMVALACSGDRRFVPSLIERPTKGSRPQYSISTVGRFKRMLRTKNRLFFLIGADAFLDLPHWKSYRRLLSLAEFVVVSRPGFSAEEIARALPKIVGRVEKQKGRTEFIAFGRNKLHILRGVEVPVASHSIREKIRLGKPITGLVPPLVEEYIRKEGLYRPGHSGRNR